MAPVRPKSRLSDRSAVSAKRRDDATGATSPLTPQYKSPAKRTRMRITLQQKQALIDNLQLESLSTVMRESGRMLTTSAVTERARRLRAQYNLQAQGLRSRIEIRVNRIPTALRKIKMGDLVLKYLEQEQKRVPEGRPTALPVKDPRLSPQKSVYGTSRSQAPDRMYQHELAGDKENELDAVKGEKKTRGVKGADTTATHPTQVLSPTSSNSRLANRDLPPSPVKSRVAKPGSPLKTHGTSRTAAVTSVLSSMVEKAKATRHGVSRKVTATSESSSSTQGPKGRRPATAMAMASAKTAPPPRPATRAGHRASGTSETSEGSTSTVVRKPTAASTMKKTTMGAIRKGVTGGAAKKTTTTTAKSSTASTSAKSVGRVLRKRG